MKKIYISGKITGLEESVYTKNFNDAEELLKSKYEVVNPLKIKLEGEPTWENYMKADLKAMLDCDCIYMLQNWLQSKGAMIEWKLASDLKFEIIYQ